MKTKFPRNDALAVAQEIIAALEPFCARVQFAGSLRRGKAEVGDVEILYLPKFRTVPDGLFDTQQIDEAAGMISQLLIAGMIRKRKNVAGYETWGPLNKLAIHASSGIPVDLFCEPSPADWWRSLVIRTGPKEFNIRLIETAARYGIRVHAYGHGMTSMKTGLRISCASEQGFVELCGLPYIEPHERK